MPLKKLLHKQKAAAIICFNLHQMEDVNHIILFDGTCVLCSRSVKFVIRHDPEGIFKFAALQSDSGKKLLEKYVPQTNKKDSFILIENKQAYMQSTAALRVVKKLRGPVKLLYGLVIVPAFLRNFVYDIIARNRKRWFGKTETCLLPTPGIKSRFIE